MKLQFWSIGKSNESYIKDGVEQFTKKIGHYFNVQWTIIPTPKNAGMMSEMDLKKKEGETILDLLHPTDFLILLDEKGKQFTSESFAGFIQQRANESARQVIFLIGGAYAVNQSLLKRADHDWSLSNLVFPHQLVRLILAEQVYRACTILRNEKYHHS